MDGDQRVFAVPRWRQARNVIGSAALVVGSLWCVGIFGDRPAGLKGVVFGVVGVVMFSAACVAWLVELVRDKPAVVVRDDGVELPSTLGDVHLSWVEIASLEIVQVRGIRFLAFAAVDSEAMIRRQNWLKALLTRLNFRKYGTVAWVSSSSLPEFDVMVDVVTAAFERRRGAAS